MASFQNELLYFKVRIRLSEPNKIQINKSQKEIWKGSTIDPCQIKHSAKKAAIRWKSIRCGTMSILRKSRLIRNYEAPVGLCPLGLDNEVKTIDIVKDKPPEMDSVHRIACNS